MSLAAGAPDDDGRGQLADDKAALAALQAYVGDWKGVGQIRRGSNQGAWTERAEWAWRFADDRAAIGFDSPQGKYYVTGRITPGEERDSFQLAATRPSDDEQQATVDQFQGEVSDEGTFILLAVDDSAESPPDVARISIRLVAGGDRLVILYEKAAGGERYSRLAEVGYTRQGSSFAKGSGQPECVVTGGLGTIEVSFEGRGYFVCCTGCRDLFNDDPAGVLADYRERKAEEKREQKE
ncbi:MAG: hypothetical protein WD278_15580 [Pirellulales bacterium]